MTFWDLFHFVAVTAPVTFWDLFNFAASFL